jgi:hypothetical protein
MQVTWKMIVYCNIFCEYQQLPKPDPTVSVGFILVLHVIKVQNYGSIWYMLFHLKYQVTEFYVDHLG